MESLEHMLYEYNTKTSLKHILIAHVHAGASVWASEC